MSDQGPDLAVPAEGRVVLPRQSRPAATPAGAETLDIDPYDVAQAEHGRLRRLWPALLGESGEPQGPLGHPVITGCWRPGETAETIRYEVVGVVEGVGDVTASLEYAGEQLRAHGWEVRTPEEGLPRVVATCEEDGAARDLLVLNAPAQGRFLVRLRSPELTVGAVRAREWVLADG